MQSTSSSSEVTTQWGRGQSQGIAVARPMTQNYFKKSWSLWKSAADRKLQEFYLKCTLRCNAKVQQTPGICWGEKYQTSRYSKKKSYRKTESGTLVSDNIRWIFDRIVGVQFHQNSIDNSRGLWHRCYNAALSAILRARFNVSHFRFYCIIILNC